MPRRVVVDSGPLVALFDRDDRFHTAAREFIRTLTAQPVSTLAVVTEVMYLLDFSVQAQTDFLQWVRNGALDLVTLEPDDLDRIIALMNKYADLPMDFADASLVAVAERLGVRRVASIDRHFSLYRYKHRLSFENVFPSGD